MATTFAQSLRALEADRPRRTTMGLFVLALLLGGFCAWFFAAEVTVHETSDAARIEVSQAAHAIDAPVAARVASVHLALGRDVAAGDILVELDAEAEQRRLAQEEARLVSFQPELDALARELASLEGSLASEQQATRAALDQARARHAEALAGSTQAEDEAVRADRLAREGAIADAERRRARAAADGRRAAAQSASLEASRLAASHRAHDLELGARAESLRRSIASLEGERRVAVAAAGVLRQEIARRTVRAAVAGRIVEDAIVRPGEFVKEGQRLGRILPPGHLRASAEFMPQAALGRVREGQPARLRLDGFPWSQYGVVPAVVSAVGGELRDGKVRVELELAPLPGSRIPLQHGLPGSVEVDVERATPAELVFRASGRALGRPALVPAQGHDS